MISALRFTSGSPFFNIQRVVAYAMYMLMVSQFVIGLGVAPASAQVGQSIETTLAEQDTSPIAAVLRDLSTAWQGVAHKLATAPTSEIHEGLREVIKLQREGGVGGLPEYSNILLKEAMARKARRDLEASRYFYSKALEISPRSAEVRFNSISLGSALGENSSLRAFLTATLLLPSDPSLCARFVLHALYPVAWALTIGLYVTLVVFSFFWFVDLLRQSAVFVPLTLRGILAPLVTAVLLVAPLCLGPLVTLLIWTLFLWVIDRRRKWALMALSIVFLVWGLVSPIRERLGLWIGEAGNQVLLSYSSGALGGADRFQLEQLTKSAASSGAAWFAYAQLLRRYGDLPGALRALDSADRHLVDSGEVASERGVIFSLMGNAERARKEMELADQRGLATVEHLYNHSRVVAESLDTAASREYLLKANATDETVLKDLQEREDKLGAKHASAFANVRLPLRRLMGSFWHDAFAPRSYKAEVLFLGLTPATLAIIGMVALLMVAIPSGSKSRRRLSPYYAGYQPSSAVLLVLRLIPGGPWAMRQNPFTAFLLFSLGAFFAMPLIGWPSDSRWLIELHPTWMARYFTILGSCTLAVVLIGFVRSEE